eukprot:TRINITY_DN3121_c0_g1_i3.p1 TRINITY_DN3121_c0_g1~~TRINITY_DN3121_c0_g1_i3.p1  ORF type:complete len:200 (-),score=50.94 TRINITY_DN3121_c0_g1_i3:18-617(-)
MFSWNVQSKDLHSLLQEKQPKAIPNLLAVRIQLDKLQSLSTDLQIKYLPTMLILHKKKIMERLVGLPDDKRLHEFYKTIQAVYDADRVEKEVKELVEEAARQINEGNAEEGIKVIGKIREREDLSSSYDGLLDSLLAKGHFKLRNITEAKDCLRSAVEFYKTAPMEELSEAIISELTSKFESLEAVSYTHLTLPTNREV